MDIKINLTPLWFVIQFVFILLKFTNYITWSWWAVFIPTWIAFVICVIFCIVLIIYGKIITKKYY